VCECGVRCIVSVTETRASCSECDVRERRAALPDAVSAQLERLVWTRQTIHAIKLLRDADPGLGLADAGVLVERERQRLGVQDPPPPTFEELCERVAAMTDVRCIEATWDGDTVHDWFVCLHAIVGDPGAPRGLAERSITAVTAGQAKGSPSRLAREIGEALAARLCVPFFFSSPEDPNDEARRWWDR
jgi:hypothetical protein